MIDLSHGRELDWLAELVGDLDTGVRGLDWILVGALARDLLLHYGHGVAISRMTTDVDFAIAIADWKAFAQAREALLSTGAFTPYRQVAHRLKHARFGWIDLIPFGAVEQAEGTIAWPPDGTEVMEVLGYAEAAATSMTVMLPNGQSARTVSLPMLAVLKVFAWQGRHRTTQGKDAIDLGLVLRSYLEAGNLERLYAEFPDVVTDDFDFESASGWLLGHDARAALAQSRNRFDLILARLEAIVGRAVSPERPPLLAASLHPTRADDGIKLLKAFRAGLSGASRP